MGHGLRCTESSPWLSSGLTTIAVDTALQVRVTVDVNAETEQPVVVSDDVVEHLMLRVVGPTPLHDTQ